MKQILDTCFSGITTHNPVVLAVSGGSDSLALLLLANVWATKNKVSLQAVTIDHGLRPEAAAEAAFVASVCAGLNIDHVTIAWEGKKPVLGIQNAARQSRYALLDQFAHEIGADVILTGHTRDDLAETVYMRMQRHQEDSDGKGLAGMARITWLYGGSKIYRPLLDVSRQALRNILNDFSQSWIEDPSNLDESYERVVVRKHLSNDLALRDRILAFTKTCANLRRINSRDCAAFLKQHVGVEKGGVFTLPIDNKQFSHPVILNAVQVLIAISGGQEYLVPRKRVKPVLEELLLGKKHKITIGGCVLEATKTGIRFYREVRNLSSMVLESGESAIWDGRLHLHNDTSSSIFIEAAKKTLIKEVEANIVENGGTKFDVQPRQALWSTPVIHLQRSVGQMVSNGNKSICLPLIDPSNLPNGLHLRLASPAIEHFCPEFDAPIRDWLLSLDRHISATIAPNK